MNQIKEKACGRIEACREDLINLSHVIHENPETAFQEYRSSKILVRFLKDHGFTVNTGIGRLDTAFAASRNGKGQGPHIAFLAEYDALPGIGHGCGHNVIAAGSAGAFLGAAAVMDEFDGKISIIGTPAEEGGAGKVILLEQGVFDDVDFAMMIHPSSGKSLIARGGRASTNIHVKFHGKAAHSANPGKGINALSAVISVFNHIDMLRPTFEMQDNVNGIITAGGTAANIIPGEAACEFSLRSRTMLELRRLSDKVKSAVLTAAQLTGAVPEIEEERIYAERYPNLPMCEALKANMEELGEGMEYPDPNVLYGSSDIGNVSICLPAIHDYLAIAPEGVNSHHPDFTKAAVSARADEVCIKAAKGLAMTAVDILADEIFREKILEFYRNQVPEEYRSGDGNRYVREKQL